MNIILLSLAGFSNSTFQTQGDSASRNHLRCAWYRQQNPSIDYLSGISY